MLNLCGWNVLIGDIALRTGYIALRTGRPLLRVSSSPSSLINQDSFYPRRARVDSFDCSAGDSEYCLS